MKFKDLFKTKLDDLQSKLTLCESKHHRLQEEINRLKEKDPTDLIKEKIHETIDSIAFTVSHLEYTMKFGSRYDEHTYWTRLKNLQEELSKLLDQLTYKGDV